MAKMTVTEAKRLARVSRSKGYFAVSATISEYWCPLSLQAGRNSHRVAVHHFPWDDGPAVVAVDRAFVEHLRVEWPEDRCEYVAQDDI
jgi:hypothetical protein